LRRRLPSHQKNLYDELLTQAQGEIDTFIAQEMEKGR